MKFPDISTLVDAEDPLEPNELALAAARHGITVDNVLEVIKQTHPRTRREVEHWLEQRYPARVKN